jgi:hypothetical protein
LRPKLTSRLPVEGTHAYAVPDSAIALIGIKPGSDRTPGGIDRKVSLSCSSGMIENRGFGSHSLRHSTPQLSPVSDCSNLPRSHRRNPRSLAGDLLNSRVRNIEIHRERLVWRYQQNGRPRELSLVLSMRRESFPEKSGTTATRCGTGGPGRTRTCNQAVMSDRISISFVDFTLFLVALERCSSRFVRVDSGAKLVRFSDSQHDPDRWCFRNWTRSGHS